MGMSMPRNPSKPVVIHPIPPQDPETRWSALGRSVPAWMVLALLPVLAVLAGTVLAQIGTP
jgi:hypothetical protein